MKRFLSVIILLSAITMSMHAQGIKFGVKGGFDIQDMKFSEKVFKTQNKLGWFVGPTVQVALPVMGLGLDIAGLYDQKSTKVNGESIEQKYILVPVNARLTLGIGEAAGLYVAAGPQFAFNIGDDVDFEWTHNDIENTFQLKKSSFSFNLGAGIYLMEHLELGFTYNIALGKTGDATLRNTYDAVTSKSTYTDDTNANAWTLSASYYF